MGFLPQEAQLPVPCSSPMVWVPQGLPLLPCSHPVAYLGMVGSGSMPPMEKIQGRYRCAPLPLTPHTILHAGLHSWTTQGCICIVNTSMGAILTPSLTWHLRWVFCSSSPNYITGNCMVQLYKVQRVLRLQCDAGIVSEYHLLYWHIKTWMCINECINWPYVWQSESFNIQQKIILSGGYQLTARLLIGSHC